MSLKDEKSLTLTKGEEEMDKEYDEITYQKSSDPADKEEWTYEKSYNIEKEEFVYRCGCGKIVNSKNNKTGKYKTLASYKNHIDKQHKGEQPKDSSHCTKGYKIMKWCLKRRI